MSGVTIDSARYAARASAAVWLVGGVCLGCVHDGRLGGVCLRVVGGCGCECVGQRCQHV